MITHVKCLQCSTYFEAARSNAKTCSLKCRKQYSRSHPKNKILVPPEPIKVDEVELDHSYKDSEGLLHLTEADFSGLFAGTFDERSIV